MLGSSMEEYLPVFLHLLAAAAIAAGILIASHFLGRRRNSRVDLSPYECGMPLLDTARKRVTVQFFLIAMIFILFDIEVAFLYPWAVLFRRLGLFGFLEMGIFLMILILGYIYLWRRGALDWDWK
ncbi:MAG: NADH-quinone oxidoreductase subunit A [Acidobacteria bacterium]|nr:NADH-quinone oxidoreductase subunit A [Acidobacteriota bacterium]